MWKTEKLYKKQHSKFQVFDVPGQNMYKAARRVCHIQNRFHYFSFEVNDYAPLPTVVNPRKHKINKNK